MNNLNNSSFKLWCYLNKNQEHYQFELSQKACAEWGIKKDSYYSAVKDLINKGYLICKNENSNIYSFYEMPFSEKQKDLYFNDELQFSENPKNNSEKQKAVSESQNINSENPQRNNTYNTIDNTEIKQSKKRVNNLDIHCKSLLNEMERDYDKKYNEWQKQEVDMLCDWLHSDDVVYKYTSQELYDEILDTYLAIYPYEN